MTGVRQLETPHSSINDNNNNGDGDTHKIDRKTGISKNISISQKREGLSLMAHCMSKLVALT